MADPESEEKKPDEAESSGAASTPASPAPPARQSPAKKSRWWDRFRRRRGPKPTGPTTAEEVDREIGRAKAAATWTDVGLRRVLGYGALVVLVLQLGVADVAFFIYGDHNEWSVPPAVMSVWLAAAVVQAWILVRVVANYLFPGSGSPPSR